LLLPISQVARMSNTAFVVPVANGFHTGLGACGAARFVLATSASKR
jgi:hypothetical protein